MSSHVSCQQGSRSRSGRSTGTPRGGERRVVVGDLAAQLVAGTCAPDPDALGGRAAAAPTASASEPASRGMRRPFVGHEVEQDQRAQLVGVAARVGLRAAHAGARGSRGRRRSPPRRRTARSAAPARPWAAWRGAARAPARAPRRCRPRRRWRRRSPAGPWCRSARRPRPPASCPGMRPTMLRRPGWPGTASKCPRGSACLSRTASLRSTGEPAGRGPSLDLAAQLGERPRRRRSGPRARSLLRPRQTPHPGARERGQEDAEQHPQSLEVTASSRSAKRSRAASRRVGTCSVGTPSSGAS